MTLPRKRNYLALILLAPGFVESATVTCLERLREAGIAVGMVALATGPTRGQYGLEVQADLTLSQIEVPDSPRLLIIPDGKEAIATLLADPRVHRLIGQTVRNGGVVAVMTGAEIGLRQASLLTQTNESSFFLQGSAVVEQFAARLIAYLQGNTF